MNLQIHHVISDIAGLTRLAIVGAILDGQRDAAALAKLRDPRVQADEETIRQSLLGQLETCTCLGSDNRVSYIGPPGADAIAKSSSCWAIWRRGPIRARSPTARPPAQSQRPK
jgi:hypothetical protein